MLNLNQQFGNKKIHKSQKTKLVQKVFDDVSDNYELMNDLMSFGLHRLWKKTLVDLINIQNKQKILDVGSGTGDIGLSIRKRNKLVKIFFSDLNLSMLKKGKKKLYNKNNNYSINLNAENLPFKNDYFDKYIISFCLRNVTNIKKALRESFRVLKPGGEFYCLEFGTVNLPLFNYLYNKYKDGFIPFLGKHVANKEYAYKYLAESINKFPNQKIIEKELRNIGYYQVSIINLFFGIVVIYKGWKL